MAIPDPESSHRPTDPEPGRAVTRRTFALSATAIASASAAVLQPAAAAALSSEKPCALRVGVAEEAITPHEKAELLAGPLKPSSGVHDELYGRVLVLENEGRCVAVVTLDALGFDIAFHRQLAQAISRETGITADCQLINSSHTHSAPLTAPWGPWEKRRDHPFYVQLLKTIPALARRACDRLQSAQARFRREPTQIGFNRRYFTADRVIAAVSPSGTVLPWVDVLSFETLDEKPLAVLFSHAAHPVVVHGSSTEISADYPGFAVRGLREKHGYAGVPLFAQGCCGNINAFPLQGGTVAARAVGEELAAAVARALKAKGDLLRNVKLAVQSVELSLPLQDLALEGRYEMLLEQETDPHRRAGLSELWRRSREAPQERRRMPCPLTMLSLGPSFALVAFAHDVFAEYHWYVNEVSPFPATMVLGYTNGLECYIGTARDYRLGEFGGYETSPRGAALLFESRLPLSPQCETLIHNAVKSMLQKLATATGS